MSNTIKTISKTDTELRVGNYIILFHGKDLQGEYFTPETEIESPHTKTGTLFVDFEHGFSELGKDEVIGTIDWSTSRTDDKGVYVERVLDRRNQYVQWIEELIEIDIVGSSSEAMAGQAKRSKGGKIERWPLRRDTLTVIPAEPRMMSENQIAVIKTLAKKLPFLKSYLD